MRAPDRRTLGYDVRFDVMNDSPQTLNDAHRLLAELSHDVRQPLTTIRMNLQAIVRLLGQERRSPGIDAALDAVRDCLDAELELNALFTGVSELARHIPGFPARVDLNLVALDAIRLYGISSRLRNPIDVRLAEPPPIVYGQASYLRHAVRTLLKHASAWDGEGASAAQLVVATRQASAYAELSVSGLPSAMIFGRTPCVPLAVTNHVARSQGGIARIESCDSAATVRIVLPGAAAA